MFLALHSARLPAITDLVILRKARRSYNKLTFGGNVEINERKSGAVTVLELKIQQQTRGQYDAFQELIRQRIAAGQLHFVLNLADCGWIDSAGLGELIKALVHVMRQGGNLKLAAVPHKVKGILAITNLSSVFEIYDDEQAALASYSR